MTVTELGMQSGDDSGFTTSDADQGGNDGPGTRGLIAMLGRSRWALLVLAVLYAAVIFAGDARAWSGSDAGGKAATVVAMVENQSWDVDVGYWAEAADPEGKYHPLLKTSRYGDRWVQVTSLPMIYPAALVWRFGGPAASLVLPALGGLLAAWGARRLAISGGARSGWGAFWLVGAGSPVLFYVADLWEHAPALGLATVAVALLIDADRIGRVAVVAGAAAGLAVAIRAEMAIYLVVLAVAAALTPRLRRAWIRRWPSALLAGATAGAVFLLNSVVERAVLSTGVQTTRTSAQLASVAQDPGERLRDALVTSVGLFPSVRPSALLIGAASVAGLVMLGATMVRHRSNAVVRAGGVLVVLAYLTRLMAGLGFVPGTFPAAPMAPAGIVTTEGDGVRRALVAAALGAMPVVWVLQWRGDLFPQWGGRYTLLTGVLLTVVAATAAERSGWRRPAAAVLVGITVLVSAYGVAWRVERTRTVGQAFDRFEEIVGDGVLVTTLPHLPREGGAFYESQRWLRASGGDVVGALDVASQMGVDQIVLVELLLGAENDPVVIEGYQVVDSTVVAWLSGTQLTAVTYRESE